MSKPSPVNKGHDSKSSSNGQNSLDTTHHRSRGRTTARCHISTHPQTRPTTPPQTQPCPPTGRDMHATNQKRSPPWLAGRLHNRGSRRNTGGLRTPGHYLVFGNQHEREGPRHIAAQGTNQITGGVRKSGAHMRAPPHTPRAESHAPLSESRPLPRAFRRAEKPEKKSCHDDETRGLRVPTWPTGCRSCNHLCNQTSQDRP
jgi:hypothetical protein